MRNSFSYLIECKPVKQDVSHIPSTVKLPLRNRWVLSLDALAAKEEKMLTFDRIQGKIEAGNLFLG